MSSNYTGVQSQNPRFLRLAQPSLTDKKYSRDLGPLPSRGVNSHQNARALSA